MVLPSFLGNYPEGAGAAEPLPSGVLGRNRPISTILADLPVVSEVEPCYTETMPDDQNQTPPPEPKPEEKPEEKPVEENPEPQQPAPTEEPPVPSEVEGKSTEETPAIPPETPIETPVETPPVIETPPPVEEQPKVEEPKPEPPKEEKPPEPEISKPEVNVEEEVKKQLDEKVSELLQKANEKRKQRRGDNLNQIIELARKKQINNLDVRDLLQVSQSTATNYLGELVKSGKLKVEKKARATGYSA